MQASLRSDTGDQFIGIRSTAIVSTVFQYEVMTAVSGAKHRGLPRRNIVRYLSSKIGNFISLFLISGCGRPYCRHIEDTKIWSLILYLDGQYIQVQSVNERFLSAFTQSIHKFPPGRLSIAFLPLYFPEDRALLFCMIDLSFHSTFTSTSVSSYWRHGSIRFW